MTICNGFILNMWWTNQIPNVPGLSFFLLSEVHSPDFMMLLFMALIAYGWKLETQDSNEVWWNVYSCNKLEQCWYGSGPLLIWDYSLLRCPPEKKESTDIVTSNYIFRFNYNMILRIPIWLQVDSHIWI